MNHFENLPPELIEFIFNKLSFDDLINLRSVDKKFKRISEQVKIKQLFVSDYEYFDPRIWFYTNDQTYFEEVNSIGIYKLLNYKSNFQLDKHLKRLTIYLDKNENYITFLNVFQKLEQLNIKFHKLNGYNRLTLENLKILEIDFLDNDNKFELILDTNKLFALKSITCDFLYQLVFNYPDKILSIETITHNYDIIKIFSNLQYLKLYYMSNPFHSDILSEFKDLKILDLNIIKIMERIEYLKEDIYFIINEKYKLERSELQIYLNGIELINQNKINQLKWPDNTGFDLLEFQIKNYDLLKDNCCYEEDINYCDLIKLIKVIPSNFTNKFQQINSVYANDYINDEDHFIKFLNCLSNLFELELDNCKLTKSFYSKFFDMVYLNRLKKLKLVERVDLKLNFDFILNLKKLEEFKTNQTIKNNDLIDKLFRENKNLTYVDYNIGKIDYVRMTRI